MNLKNPYVLVGIVAIAILAMVIIVGATLDWRDNRRKAAAIAAQDAEDLVSLKELIEVIKAGGGKSAADLQLQLRNLYRAHSRNYTQEEQDQHHHILAVRAEYEHHVDPTKRNGVADRREQWIKADPYTAVSAIAYARLVEVYATVKEDENKQRLAKKLDLPGMSPNMLFNWCVQIYDRLITEARGGSRESFLELHKLIGASRGINLVDGYKSLDAQIDALPYPEDWDQLAIRYWEIPLLEDLATRQKYFDLPTGTLSKMAWDALQAGSELDLAVVLAYCNADDEARDELGDYLYAEVLDARERLRADRLRTQTHRTVAVEEN